MKKRILSMLMACAMIFTMLPTAAAAEVVPVAAWNVGATTNTSATAGTGTPADNVKAKLFLNEDGETYTLSLSGSGNMYDFGWNPIGKNSSYIKCWHTADYAPLITDIVFEEGSAITSVGNSAFFNLDGLTGEIVIPDSVTHIGSGAFDDCDNITSLDIGNVTSAGSYAFEKCDKLKSVTALSLQSTGNNGQFGQCPLLKTVSFGADLSFIDGYAFVNSPIQNVHITSSNENYTVADNVVFSKDGKKLIWAANGKTGKYTIPDGVTAINRQAIRDTSLQKVVFCEGLTTVGLSNFNNAPNISQLRFPSTISVLDGNSFIDDASLHTFDFSKATQSIDIKTTKFFSDSSLNGIIYLSPANSENTSKFLSQSGSNAAVAQTNGGLFSDDVEFEEGVLSTDFAAGWKFDGWFTDAAMTTELQKTDGKYCTQAEQIYYAKVVPTVTLYANDGTENKTIQEFSLNTAFSLEDPSLSQNGYVFDGWNTKADGTGTHYANCANMTLSTPLVLYAQWEIRHSSNKWGVVAIPDQTYTGREIEPEVVVVDGSGIRVNSGYTVEYSSNNINAGTATATAINNEGQTVEMPFVIVQDKNPSISMEDVSVTFGTPYSMKTKAETSVGYAISGDDTVVIKYYTDAGCTSGETDVAPTDVGTYWAKATLMETNNYAEASTTAKITISAATVDVLAEGYSDVYDGQPHSITVTADGATVTYALEEDGAYSSENPSYTDVGEYTVYYKVTKPNHEDVSGSQKIKITPATLTIAAESKSMYVNGTLPELTYTVSPDVVLTEVPTLTCDGDGKTVGNYVITANGADAGSNYEITYVPGTLTVNVRMSSGGSHTPTYSVTGEEAENGKITVSRKWAYSGSTITITATPDAGYKLGSLTVADTKGNEIKLTDKGDGTYTFKMPGGKVTIEATFVEIEAFENLFVDVAEGAYYYDAVLWAAENGITGGTSATTFSPAAACTRAQTVTFLWRAAGSPEPETVACPFDDVDPSAYYYKAVLWAAENGITGGTSATTFSPDATVTRAQTVTFLWRVAGSPTAKQTASFNDVAADAYYHDAVVWAADEAITSGTSTTTFGHADPCLRSQIVTFLYRYYVD